MARIFLLKFDVLILIFIIVCNWYIEHSVTDKLGMEFFPNLSQSIAVRYQNFSQKYVANIRSINLKKKLIS